MIDTTSLQLFVRIAELHVIAEAGRELNLSAASTSARLAKLEQTLGFQLFNRSTRAVSLTTDGEVFLPYAIQLIETLDSGISAVNKKDDAVKGVLRMAMPASFGRMYIVPLLGQFRERYPNINLDLRLSDEFIDMTQGGYDLAIRNSRLEDSSLVARKLADDQRILVASSSYLKQTAPLQSISDLKKHKVVTLGTLGTQLKFNNGEQIKLTPSSMVNDGEVMRALIEQGFGLGLKSLWNVSESLASGALVKVLSDFPLKTDSAIWLLFPKGRVSAPKVRIMVDYLIEQFTPTLPWEASHDSLSSH